MVKKRRFAGEPLKLQKDLTQPADSLVTLIRTFIAEKIISWVARALKVAVLFFCFTGSLLVGVIAYISHNPLTFTQTPAYLNEALISRVPGYKVSLSSLVITWNTAARAFVAQTKNAYFESSASHLPSTTIPQLELHFPLTNLLRLHFLPGLIGINNLDLTLDLPDSTIHEKRPNSFDWEEFLGGIDQITDISIHKGKITLRDPHTRKTMLLTVVAHKTKDYMRAVATLPLGGSQSCAVECVSHDGLRMKVSALMKTFTPKKHMNVWRFCERYMPVEGKKYLSRITLPLSGKIGVVWHIQKGLQELFTDVHIEKGTLKIPEINEKPYKVLAARIKGSLGIKGLFIENTDISLPQGRVALHINAPYEQHRKELVGKVSIKGTELDLSQLRDVWPVGLGDDARTWITTNIHKGSIPKITLNADYTVKNTGITDRISPSSFFTPSHHKIANIQGHTVLQDASVEYMDNMPLVTDINASGPFDSKTFTLKVTSGRTEAIEVREGEVIIRGFQDARQYLDVTIGIHTDLRAALVLANEKPLHFMDEYSIDPQNFSGKSLVNLMLSFPLQNDLTPKDIQAQVIGHASDVFMKKLSPEISIPLEKGTFDVRISNKGKDAGIALKGSGSVLGEETMIEIKENFIADEASAEGKEVKNITLATSITDEHIINFVPQLRGVISGKAPLTLKRQFFHRAQGTADGTLNLTLNLTPVLLDIPLVKLHKPYDEAAVLQLELAMIGDMVHRINRIQLLESERIHCEADAQWDIDARSLKRASMKLQYPEGHVDCVLMGLHQQILESEIRIHHLDAKELIRIISASENDDQKPDAKSHKHKIKITVDKVDYGNTSLVTNVGGAITFEDGALVGGNLEGSRPKDGGVDLFRFDAARTQEKELHYKITAENLESFFAALEVDTKVKSSQVEIDLKRRADGNKGWKGSYTMKDLVLADAPPVIRLLKVLSPTAITELFSDKKEGIVLSSVTGQFRYHDDVLHLVQGRAASASVGFTYEGTIELDTQLLDITGTLIPAYGLNTAVGYIPIIGHILSGGPGQGLVAFSFAVQGKYSDPVITSNPLSALTPGFLKKIFSDSSRAEKNASREKKSETDEKEDSASLPVKSKGMNAETKPIALPGTFQTEKKR
ncbi:MAG: AsmA-like C-terminal domain-containing protein [Alphaproteobacteria bacterium]|nr:MAG: AsmA-like C-terminal domain-containing protein [Alphaproteobacteria bacterium]